MLLTTLSLVEQEAGTLSSICCYNLFDDSGWSNPPSCWTKENITHGGCDDGKAVESGGYCLPAKCKADRNYIIIIVNYPLQMLSLLLAPGMEIQRSFRVPTDLPWRRWWSWDWKPLWVKIRLINNLNYSCRPSLASRLEYMDIPAPLPVIWP